MPELPEVETMRLGIASVIGARIVTAQRAQCKKRPLSIEPRIDHLNRRVAGARITATERVGKRVVLVLSTEDRLVFEPRMTGLVLIDDPPTQEHLRFLMLLDECGVDQLMFWDRRGLGQIRLYSTDEFTSCFMNGKIGPDALQVDASILQRRLGKSGREIKVALLDQAAIAGIGNLYASEILHLARVHPQARCDRLSQKQWNRINTWIHKVLSSAIKYEGSTLADGTYRTAQNDPGSYQNHHRVYDRKGKRCPGCRKESIQRIVQAQRSTFFCKKCQTKTDRNKNT